MNSKWYFENRCGYWLIIYTALVGGFSLSSCSRHPAPNVVLIVVDDLGYADISCAGLADDVFTPNIDRLAEHGIRFTQAYATSPICSPSRAGIITGCYQERWGTFWYGGPGIHDPGYRTIAEIVKEKGYRTGYIGKVHYGSHDSVNSDRSFPLNHGFDYFFGFTSARKHYLVHDQQREDEFQRVKAEHNRQGQSLRQQGLWENSAQVDTLAYSTRLFADKAVEFMNEHQKNPFFLQLSFNAVHNFTHQLPSEYLEEKQMLGYHDWDPAREEYYEWYKKGRYPNNPEGRAHYLGQLHFLDEAIGTVMDGLRQTGLEENTLVVFISDNGGSTPIYAINFPLKGSKYVLNEGGIRVPVIFSWPAKYGQGNLRHNVISAMDILPSICRAVGVQSPGNIDGMDLSMLLTGADTTLHHDTLVWDTRHEIAVRAGNWKYHLVKNNENAVYEMVEIELGEFLYDLEKDPGEKTNLAGDFPEIVDQLKACHQRWYEGLHQGPGQD